jgi:hypothetical protein
MTEEESALRVIKAFLGTGSTLSVFQTKILYSARPEPVSGLADHVFWIHELDSRLAMASYARLCSGDEPELHSFPR